MTTDFWSDDDEDELNTLLAEADKAGSPPPDRATDQEDRDPFAAGTDADDSDDESDATQGLDLVETLAEESGAEQAQADETFKAQWAQAQKMMPGYQPPPEPLTRMEETAQKVAAMDPNEWTKFAETLRAANQKLADDAAVKRGELVVDDDGAYVSPEPAFDPSGLSSEDFNTFVAAVSAGGASPARVPAGETYATWSKKVDSAIGER